MLVQHGIMIIGALFAIVLLANRAVEKFFLSRRWANWCRDEYTRIEQAAMAAGGCSNLTVAPRLQELLRREQYERREKTLWVRIFTPWRDRHPRHPRVRG